MVGKESLDPSDVGKHPKLIKNALVEMSQSDVLICGKCHEVFHFIDSFQEHKENECAKESPLKECRDSKPKIWAFLLWKSSQLGNSNSSNLSSWQLYQQWIRLDEQTRETWTVAGKTILSFAKLSQGILNEMPVKITKTVVENLSNKNQQSGLKQTTSGMSQKFPSLRKDESEDTKSPIVRKVNPPMAIKYPTPSPSSAATATSTQKPISRIAKRTIPNTNGQEIEEEIVSKIIAKRFNPRRKMHEYLVNWEGLSNDQNTWEPQTHLETCQQLLDSFEKQLARQKEQRAKQQQQQQQQQKPSLASPSSPNKILPSNRPIITSTKIIKKAEHHDEDTPNTSVNTSGGGSITSFGSGLKRKLDESSISDFDSQEFDDDDIPTHAIKKIKNGAAVLVKTPDSKVTTQQGQTKSQIGKSTSDGGNVVIAKDSQSTGVFKRSGSFTPSPSKEDAQIRVLSKGDVGHTGVVRIGANSNSSQGSSSSPITTTGQLSAKQKLLASSVSAASGGRSGSGIVVTSIQHIPAPQSQQQQTTSARSLITQRTGSGSTSANISPGNTAQISQVQTHRIVMTSKDNQQHISSPSLPSSTSLTIKPSVQTRIVSKPSPQAGRATTTTVQRTSNTTSSQMNQRNIRGGNRSLQSGITPEQKIIQLSKSGDLKVTRKVITQPISPQPAQHSQQIRQGSRQNILQQQRQQQQQSLHTRTSSISKSESEHSQSPIPQEQSNEPTYTLCEITGKVIRQGPDGEIIESDDKFSEGDDKQQQANELLQAQSTEMQSNQQAIADAFAASAGSITTLEDGTQQFIANEDGSPILVTGEDGTIYQVAGKNADGQTILIAQNADGEHQLAYIAAEEGDESGILNLDNSQVLAKQQQSSEVMTTASSGDSPAVTQYIIKQDGEAEPINPAGSGAIAENISQGLEIKTGDGEGTDGNIPAEVVQADLPSPGGTRRVVLLLQDGTFMMTEMHDDEYQALNLVQ